MACAVCASMRNVIAWSVHNHWHSDLAVGEVAVVSPVIFVVLVELLAVVACEDN